MKKVVIVDYGLGNILSAQQSFIKSAFDNNLEADIKITNNPKDIDESSHIVLPGQGAFKSCLEGLKETSGMISALKKNVLENKKPFLGICVGMQLLAEVGDEFGIHKGLGWIKGKVIKLKSNVLPHIGWNEIKIKKKNLIFNNLSEKDFYFVHSFYFDVKEKNFVLASTNYKSNFCSVVNKQNIYGVQFHPEKSQQGGKQIIKNFLINT